MDRAGMAASTPDPSRTLESTAEDYAEFAAAVAGVGPAEVPVVAHSQGAVFGLAMSARRRAGRLVLVSPADEVAHPRIAAMLPEEVRRFAGSVNGGGAGAAELLRKFDAARMEAMVIGGADGPDRAVYAEPGFRARYRAALSEGFANDGAAYRTDTVLAMSPWTIPWDSIDGPVQILFGARDLVHSPDQGAFLAERIPLARRRIVEGAGAALLWTHARDVLAAATSPRSSRG
jgi:pimeloyl-ACP methyl ester carboxylesterase